MMQDTIKNLLSMFYLERWPMGLGPEDLGICGRTKLKIRRRAHGSRHRVKESRQQTAGRLRQAESN